MATLYQYTLIPLDGHPDEEERFPVIVPSTDEALFHFERDFPFRLILCTNDDGKAEFRLEKRNQRGT
jgi:hypothetical protein